MRPLLAIAHGIDAFTEFLGKINIFIVTAMVIIGFGNVVLRYIGRAIGQSLTSNVFIELQWYMFSVLFFLGFAYILKHNLNVRVDFLYGKLNLKQQAWIDLLGTMLFLVPFCILGLYVTWNPVLVSWGRQFDGSFGTWEVSPDPGGLPRAPIKSMILVAFSLLLLQAISQIIKYIAILTETVKPEQAASEIEEYHSSPVE
jgi:TRAP-type mannitol/chloroaromatic compound transport system permease small subunit